MPRSSKPPDTCKWGGNELRGILKFSRELSNPSHFANYSKLSSQQFFSLRCRYFVSTDLKTYLLNCASHCRPRKRRAWQPITWPNMFPIYRAINNKLSRDILILSRDKKNVACPLWATVMITILRWLLYVIISVDRFDVITPQGIGKGITRFSMGWWLLRLTVKILANLRLTVNTFPLFPPDILFAVNFFYD